MTKRNMEKDSKELAVYIHLPFCVRKCLYCDFVSGTFSKEVQKSYVNKLLWEIDSFFEALRQKSVISSVFFGGGTPSILPPEEIERILCKLKEHAEFINPEITIEVNPGTVNRNNTADGSVYRKDLCEGAEDTVYPDYPEDIFRKYRAMGINRISIGLQSTFNEELKTLGRIHTYEEFISTLEAAKAAGFTNINADWRDAIPGQNFKSFESSLRKTASLGLTHISAYSLIIEEGTPFYEMDLNLPSEEEERRMYESAAKILSEYGYRQYEISNYAQNGFECRHNIAYWTRKEYAGFGVAAASLIGNLRYTNTESIEEYLNAADYESLKKLRTDVEKLSREECMSETVILGLRMNDGVLNDDFLRLYGRTLREAYGRIIEKHMSEGLLTENKNGDIALTAQGRNLSNYVMADFM